MKTKRLAVITMAFNESFNLPYWLHYYSRQVDDLSDISILDQIVGKKVFVEKFYYLAAFHKPRNLRLTEEENKDSIFYVNYTLFKKLCCLLIEKAKVKKIFYAGSSRIFEGSKCKVAAESASSMPRSFYGEAKSLSREFCRELNMKHGVPTFNGILFNHESPRRGETFVTRKITRGLARIDAGLEDCLYMGNLDSLRDWGHARDYVEMQWRMLQQEGPPEDFVIATGRQESVRRFIELAASELGWGAIEWEGKGLEETGKRSTGEVVVRIDPRYFRPAEVETLLGDPAKAKEKLGWTPTTTLEELVAEMVATDKEEAKKEAYLKLKGFNVVGSMENPPTNPDAVKAAGGKA